MKFTAAAFLGGLGIGLVNAIPVEDIFGRAVGESCKGPQGEGKCQSKGECKGISYPQAFCPNDPADIQCCVEIKCQAGGGEGFCRSVSNNECSNGSFHAGQAPVWPCPGDEDIQCCVEGGDNGGGSGPGAPAPPENPPPPPGPAPPSGGGQVNEEALELLKTLEGFRADFYVIEGHKTIGYGHDCVANGDCDSINAPISQEEATELYRKDLDVFEKCVCELENAAALNENQYGALVSFAYNSGCGGVSNYWSGSMQNKNFNGICEALPSTNTLDGLLTSRREQEGALCGKPSDKLSGC